MAYIESGVDNTIATVDPTSKAIRATLYDSSGREMNRAVLGSYMTSFEVRHTGAPAAGTTVFNFRGPATNTARIRRVSGHIGFTGIAVASTLLRYGFYRGAGSASPTSGTAKTSGNGEKSVGANWTAQDIRCDLTGAGLTTTSITYEADPFYVVGVGLLEIFSTGPATALGWTAPQVPFDLYLNTSGDDRNGPVELASSGHFAIRVQTVSAIIGLYITGGVEWDEIA